MTCNRQIKKRTIIATLMAMVIAISFFPIASLMTKAAYRGECNLAGASSDMVTEAPLMDTKEELDKARKEKEEKEKELSAAKNQLDQTNANLSSLKSEQSSYQGKMNTLNTELQLVADNLTVIEVEMDLKRMEIEDTKRLLEETIAMQNEQYQSMKDRIRFLYEKSGNMYLEMLFTSKDFGQFLNYADYIERINEYDRKKLDEYIETGKAVSANMVALQDEYDQMTELEEQALEEQSKVTGLISKTAENIANTAESINAVSKEVAAYEAACDQKAAEAAKANAEYEAIKAQYEEELRLAEIARASAWRDISEVTFDEGDRYLLANLIYCEAGNQPYEGQLAVGAVVINRLLSSKYPNTVTGVIYQNKQFSPVGDGHLASALASDKATASCYQAADAAMGGTTNVGNCLYFRTPIEGITGMQIGAHIFY